LSKRKAIYKYYPQGIPSVYTIDAKHCRVFQGKKCGVCQKICPAQAVDYNQTDKIVYIQVGAIILATGYDIFDPSVIPEYGYGRIKNVITALEFERLLSATGPTKGHLQRPSDIAMRGKIATLEKRFKAVQRSLEKIEHESGKLKEDFYGWYAGAPRKGESDPLWANMYSDLKKLNRELRRLRSQEASYGTVKRVAFIQCVGSRDFRHHKHCSAYCCMHSIKEAIVAKEHEPHIQIYVFYMDLRTVGKGFEKYRLWGEMKYDIEFIRGRAAEIEEDENNNAIVWYEDTTSQKVKNLTVDLVVLATACVPVRGIEKLAKIMGFALDESGFIKTDPLYPVDTTVHGIFACGCAQGPMDIPESVAQASGAALRAAEVVQVSKLMEGVV
jgi:heterodisulfide reductase subunit A-like polyferredoxin